ncbi:MAG: helix-turn-helix domain-containing protein [Gammaproteobacteria bacterium]|nr:helix-turn-helix domain-containing protein [Gammaproteobacteria bacterium]
MNESRSTGIGPGERLQAARIQLGLSLDDVAGRMHLSTAILSAIEENNFEEITAPIFVKGYLRAYARIVSLDEDDMILQYVDYYSEEDPPISSTSNVVPELSVADVRMKWTTYLVVVALAVLLAAWWWNKEQSSETPISLDTQSSEEQVNADSGTVNSEIEAVSEDPVDAVEVVTPADSQPVEEPAAEEPAAEEPAAEEPVTIEAVAEEEPAEVVTAPQPMDAVSAETGDNESDSSPAGTVQSAPIEPVRLAPSGSDKLRIIVHADTWADIKDANDYQLVYDLLRADGVVELTGQAPFSVFLGNGKGVEIMFNGEAIEVAPRVRDDNTARLRIGS